MLIYDIETATNGKPNPETDTFKFIGMYSYENKKYYFLNQYQTDEIKTLFKQHRIIIGFNNKYYDDPILKRTGLLNNNHLILDLREIIKKRRAFLKLTNESLSLDNIAKKFGLKQQKTKGFNYEILKQNGWNTEELKEIETYTLQDIKTTKEMFEHVYNYFKPFKEFMDKNDQYNYKWLTSTMASYSYKVICHYAGLKEEYNDEKNGEWFKGAIVIEPTTNEAHKDIYCFDFNSLYPHNNIQGNLYSYNCNCCTEDDKWRGNELFPIKGAYCTKKQGVIERTLQMLYDLRQEYKKKKDSREYALKIVLNSFYGASANPIFKNIYNPTTASDCTLIGRQSIMLAKNKFEKAGYKVLYGDTDSIYLQDEFKNEERLLKVKVDIVNTIKQNLPFPSKTFDMGVDEKIKHIWFFKNSDGYKKKYYMYVNDENKVVIKGLPMIKSDSSKVAYKVFKQHMIESVKTGNIKFNYEQVKSWVEKILTEDYTLITRKFKVYKASVYKNSNQLQAQISERYGEGIHYLIPNNVYGVGKGSVKYCTVEEFESQKLVFKDLNLSKFWSEIKIFIGDYPEKLVVTRKFKKVLTKEQRGLLEWTNIE